MTIINRQKFLAELGKLLTFMYEEDRQTALAMYGKMFDDAEDEQDLIQFLNSPTRQAVVIARAYNARARKLQVESHSREEDDAAASPEAAPDFVLAIDGIYRQYFPAEGDEAVVMDDQYSLFGEGDAPVQDGPDELYPVVSPELPAETPAEEEPGTEESPAQETIDEVDEFLEGFALGELPAEELPKEEELPGQYLQESPVVVRKARVFLLILFVLLAVPVTLLGIAVLLLPTLLFLALAAAVIVAGVQLVIAAFGGFKILADFLLLFGAAVVLLALGLLFLWIFIWFVGGVMAGLVTGVIALGRRWCYKEVSA